jgi:hypothetical protein
MGGIKDWSFVMGARTWAWVAHYIPILRWLGAYNVITRATCAYLCLTVVRVAVSAVVGA